MMFNKLAKKSWFFLLTFLVACNITENQNVKANESNIFSLDLTDEGISSEGGGIELHKEGKFCLLLLNVYEESGQEKYRFKFKKNNLIETSYFKYRYPNGLLVNDDDLKDLIAHDENANPNSKDEMELVKKDLVIGQKNKEILQKFFLYKQKVPNDLLNKNCN